MNSELDKAILDHARQALLWQLQSGQRLAEQLDTKFLEAVHVVAAANKVLTTGLGKSGFIAKKMAATLTSVRIPGIFLHPVEAMHGDSGILQASDCLVAFSKSGETSEVVRLCHLAKDVGLNIVAITARANSSLALLADTTLYTPIERELDPDDVLPTASSTVALITADLLAVGAAMMVGDVASNLRHSHPRGMLGAALMRTVEDVMHVGASLPFVRPDSMLVDALAQLSAKALGIVCVVDEDGMLRGILTDGDVRRIVVEKSSALANLSIDDVMISDPTTIEPSATLHTALRQMERRQTQISVLPVTIEGRCVGVLRLHDIVRLQV
ncbi:MAG: KpsF/GutQ family sugar-phosphate isomerase [bacterium]|nr:KpsF/GutQ family sugar-phosphate isomerase [bacterium]